MGCINDIMIQKFLTYYVYMKCVVAAADFIGRHKIVVALVGYGSRPNRQRPFRIEWLYSLDEDG